MQSTKERIKAIVKEYTRVFPLEYEQFLNSHRQKQDTKMNEFAEFKQHNQLVRQLFDVPETLYLALKLKLTEDQFDWLYGFNEHEGQRAGLAWFIRTFPQFKITEDF